MGRLDPLPLNFPPYLGPYQPSEEETFAEFNREQDIVETLAKRYDLASWVAVNQLVYLPIEKWIGQDDWTAKHGLDDYMKRAIASEVEKIVRDRESKQREMERKHEMEKANVQSKLQFPRDPGSSISRILNY